MASDPASLPPESPPYGHTRRDWLYIVIFEAETPMGRLFDVALLWVIIASVVTVAIESVDSIAHEHQSLIHALEWFYTGLFTIEYGLRIYCARRRLRYMVSFFGVIDLLALLPTYVSLVLPGVHTLLVVRALRLLRVFRVLKAVRLMGEAHTLLNALRASMPKISVFVGAVSIIALIVGSAMYIIEGAESGFTSIPRGMYWAIVTMTTVGYGDIAPTSDLGQFLAACLMILGYGILAVPTGIVSAEIVSHAHDAPPEQQGKPVEQVEQGEQGPELLPPAPPDPEPNDALCHACGAKGHHIGANFCYVCGSAVD